MIISAERYYVKLNVQTSKYLLYNKAVSIKTTILWILDEDRYTDTASGVLKVYTFITYTLLLISIVGQCSGCKLIATSNTVCV